LFKTFNETQKSIISLIGILIA